MPNADEIKRAYGGYAGWNDPNAIIADYNATGGAGKGSNPYALGGGTAPVQSTTPNPTSPAPVATNDPRGAQDLVGMGFNGYQGWGDAEAIADYKATGGAGKGQLRQQGTFNQPSIDLPGIYKSLFDNSDIGKNQAEFDRLSGEVTKRQQALNDAMAKINNNPFYSEATRVGKLRKLDEIAQNDINTIINQQNVLQNRIATSKADIETQLNLQTKQFDINSQQAQQAIQQFNNLLQFGALDNASDQDIANLTRSTGISSSMIRSAIETSKKSKEKDVPTSVISFDDGTNQGFSLINTQTGEVISTQNIAGSKPTKGGGGGGSDLSPTQHRNVTATARQSLIDVDTNEDKMVSLQEYQDAVQQIMTASGIDFNEADDYATKAFNDLGYRKWNW